MMVFIPFSNPIDIAKALDYKRLGKQRVEARQILALITGEAKWTAWRHHPAVLMWTGHAEALKYYYNIMIKEWVARGYVNTMKLYELKEIPPMPWFMFCEPVLLSHRATLLRKDYNHYCNYFTAPKSYIVRNVLWPITGEKYLTETKLKKLKSLVDHPDKKIKIAEYVDKFSVV
jgi:hypothetical protein